jgi:hypothetical protein
VCYFNIETYHTHTNMKKLSIILAVAIALTAPTFAAANARKGKGGPNKAQHACMKAVKGFDTDKNGQIDGKEIEALKAAFAGNAALKQLDTNANGKLDDDEITALNAKLGRHAKGKGKRAGKGKGKGAANAAPINL